MTDRMMKLEERQINSMDALDAIRTRIGILQSQRNKLWEHIVAIDGQITGLQDAFDQVEKL